MAVDIELSIATKISYTQKYPSMVILRTPFYNAFIRRGRNNCKQMMPGAGLYGVRFVCQLLHGCITISQRGSLTSPVT